jgi:hypothetical protein
MFESRQPLRCLCSVNGIVTVSSYLSCFSDAVFPSLTQMLKQTLFFLNEAFRNPRITFNTHKNKHLLRSHTEDYCRPNIHVKLIC